ncbi:MAG TPA: flagellin [Verrucomicrobiae bacterium]|nr:flagellin [Verrucomicrobiae bacterium]
MISNLTPSAEAFLANMNRAQMSVEEASRQVSSGKRVNVASDAPDEIDAILQLHADEARNSQIETNLSLAKTDADTADNALNSATQLMDRARVLGAQGATFTIDATGRQSLADEVESLLEQMVAVSQTTVQGRYIFSGDQDGGPAYTLDLTQPTGVIAVNTSAATRRVEDPAGGSFAVTQSASDIFDTSNPDGTPADDNVFAALNNLRLALTNNDTDQINAAVQSVQLASNRLNTSQAFYGSVQNRIQDATNYANSYDVQLKTELSQKEDADVTAAAMALNQGNLQLQAAFQMEAKMPRTSLFDYIG